ncbi:hypothetical protein pmac_cds_903 [Pandoravirus macleodensis]|uniref:Uncharacterized protein n=1 Tax=Pandoravirus macleodensis TaxID=2107707 RepID=A0A2U7UI34_9VIRU|nr:hypothetical protein pmac_cds_903 [Pandoravirus macleodensis]AVK77591.1 hypothetical protein pmac_cds_903 [Pandoravirus macleodensis]UMO80409.1 hypothetical protein [Pandoravirus aubagnensis]
MDTTSAHSHPLRRRSLDNTRGVLSVCAGLPIELWGIVANLCGGDHRALASMSATSRALRRIVAHTIDKRVDEARTHVDRMVDAWERWSAPFDVQWTENMVCGMLAGLPHQRPTHIVRHQSLSGFGAESVYCDDCVRACGNNLVDARRIELREPHVWTSYWSPIGSCAVQTCCVAHTLSHRIDVKRYVVPEGMGCAVNLLAAAWCADIVQTRPPLYVPSAVGGRDLPSARSWLPVGPVAVSFAINDVPYQTVLFVCCQTDHERWGELAVFASSHSGSGGLAYWMPLHSSMATLLARYKTPPAAAATDTFALWMVEYAMDL